MELKPIIILRVDCPNCGEAFATHCSAVITPERSWESVVCIKCQAVWNYSDQVQRLVDADPLDAICSPVIMPEEPTLGMLMPWMTLGIPGHEARERYLNLRVICADPFRAAFSKDNNPLDPI